MEALIKASQFLLGISILVVIHELGHYMAARAFGIKVEKFYLFFDVGGFKLFKIQRGDTEYGIGWLPLGGYVKIVGMIDESMDKDFVQSEPKPWEFRSKPAWQRLIVMLGGIIMNVLLGILLFTLHTFYYGEDYISAKELNNGVIAHSLAEKVGFKTGDKVLAINDKPLKWANELQGSKLITEKHLTYTVEREGKTFPISLPDTFAASLLKRNNMDSFLDLRLSYKVGEINKKSPAESAGLKEGDSIVAVNGTPTPYFNALSPVLRANKGKPVTLNVHRYENGQLKQLDLKAEVDTTGKLGFKPLFNDTTVFYSFGQSFTRGTERAWSAVTDNVKALARLVRGELPASRSVSGLIGIGNAFSPTWDWKSFWFLVALLSMILAFMNLLPIPALDGGHVLFLLVEMIRRKPLSYRFLEVAQMIGMAILFLLMGFALYNDVTRYIFKW